MFGHFLVAILLFALVRARAIVTNECQHNVWIWSVPFIGSSHTENVPIKPGGQYQEPWRLGLFETPGVAIKVSTQANGIDMQAEEISFAYSISSEDKSKIWINLSPVHGAHLFNRASFHSCVPEHTTANAEPHQCNTTDEVELVLCGSTRTVPATENASLEQIQACYQPNSVGSEVFGNRAEYHGSFEAFSTGFDTVGTEGQAQDSPKILHAHCGAHWYDCSACNDEAVHEDPPFEEEPPVNDDTPVSDQPLYSDKLPVVHYCQAKVIYPGRRNIRTSSTPRSMQSAPIKCHEQQASLCEIVERYHPSYVDGCDEEAMKARARAVYPHICEPESEPFLMGFSCEDVAKELRSVYPEVTNTTKATKEQHNSDCKCPDGGSECLCSSDMKTSEDLEKLLLQCPDDRECLSNFCEPALPGIKCAYITRKLRAAAKSFGVSYRDLINEDMETCPATPRTTLDGRPIVCIAKLCAQLNLGECGGVRTLLEHTAKNKFNKDIEFSADEAVCGN
ncbi:uncharacterized protein yc1106_08639 [Curvularia clavata]|uniref:Uncharacterized protein n=1 Tax=Curvularia clavata TaxID=95742 RepID=A0A9Q8ZGN0_CURCL|nr:uncharacterized protein yc1106_08639 [Curvularia clavata]